MSSLAEGVHPAGSAFDVIAASYDAIFTTSVIGRSQRNAVWAVASRVFRRGDRVLELNCGTGEDALFLAGRGIKVTACDASPRMIEQARARADREPPPPRVSFHLLPSEQIHRLPPDLRFEGVLSNFSGLNCIANLSSVAQDLYHRLAPGAQLLLCLSTRFCLWEILHYSFRKQFSTAFRRCRGFAEAKLAHRALPVYYPTLRSIRGSFRGKFRLHSVTGIGVAVPPSYMEDWARRNPRLFRACELLDHVLSRCPGLRVLGDHMLLHLEKVP